MDNVKDALKTLIDGERGAVQMYTAFGEKAKEEGFENIALLFKALVAAEKIHIKNHLNALGEEYNKIVSEEISVKSTMENVEQALKGEVEENKHLYPRLIKSIKKSCGEMYGKVARLSMVWARDVEKEHAKLLNKALKSLKTGSDISFEKISICQVCGNIVLDDSSEKECAICGHDAIFFQAVGGVK